MNTTKFLCKYFSFDNERVSAATMLFFCIIYAAIIVFILSGFYGIFMAVTIPDYFANIITFNAPLLCSTLTVGIIIMFIICIVVPCYTIISIWRKLNSITVTECKKNK